MTRFRRTSQGVSVRFAPAERELLESLFGQLASLLAEPAGGGPGDPLEDLVGMTDGPVAPSDDPAVARLFPDAYDDPALATEYRRLTEHELRGQKSAAARAALDSLARADRRGRVLLDEDGAQAWLSALNDVRLVLGTRYGVTEDTYDRVYDLPDDDPQRPGLVVFTWLGALQETLVEALAGW